MQTKILAIVAIAVMAAASCGQKKAEHFNALPFPDKVVPEILESPQERADYLAEHFWDEITDPSREYPSDSVLVSGVRKEEFEQKFANWISILDMTSLETSEKSIIRLYNRASACETSDSSSNVFEMVTTLATKYLHDANSPLRNEEYYLHFVSRMAHYGGYSPEIRDKYAYHAQMCSLNRLGRKAADFRFADKRGRIQTLYSIDSPVILLFFSNPGCEACMDIIETLQSYPEVSEMICSGVLSVLNIYIDEDITAWRDYMSVYPEEWFNGFDVDMKIRTDNLYNVRAIPSLYILDSEKRVIMKDAPENKVLSYILKSKP